MAEVSAKTADNISQAVSILTGKLDEVKTVADNTTIHIERSGGKLEEQTEQLITVSSKVVRVADEASETFSRQSNALFKAAEDAAQRAETIRKGEWRTQRDAFFGSAKFVVESLHSLSVDITRMIDGEIPEKTWKSYQKGDVNAFTARLVDQGDELPLERMRSKYSSDSEFRTYINRFVRQYEEVFEQAILNDHGALLTSTFASSDIGKLYKLLCSVASRVPREPTQSKQAA